GARGAQLVPVDGQRVGVQVVRRQVAIVLVADVLDGAVPARPVHAHRDGGAVGVVETGAVQDDGDVVSDARARARVGIARAHDLGEGDRVAGAVGDVGDADAGEQLPVLGVPRAHGRLGGAEIKVDVEHAGQVGRVVVLVGGEAVVAEVADPASAEV